MKKKIAVIFLAVCFLSAPLSAKAMMFDALPTVNQNSVSQVSGILALLETAMVYQRGEIDPEQENAIDSLEAAFSENGDPNAKIEGLIGLIGAIDAERGSVIDDIVDIIEEFLGVFDFLSDLLDEDVLDILIVIALVAVVIGIID